MLFAYHYLLKKKGKKIKGSEVRGGKKNLMVTINKLLFAKGLKLSGSQKVCSFKSP